MIEVGDAFDRRLTVVTIAKSDRATIIHPLCWLTENPLFMDLSSAVGQESSPKVFRDTFGQADGQETKISLTKSDIFGGGNKTGLQFQQCLTFLSRTQFNYQLLFNQFHSLRIEPSQQNRH